MPEWVGRTGTGGAAALQNIRRVTRQRLDQGLCLHQKNTRIPDVPAGQQQLLRLFKFWLFNKARHQRTGHAVKCRALFNIAISGAGEGWRHPKGDDVTGFRRCDSGAAKSAAQAIAAAVLRGTGSNIWHSTLGGPTTAPAGATAEAISAKAASARKRCSALPMHTRRPPGAVRRAARSRVHASRLRPAISGTNCLGKAARLIGHRLRVHLYDDRLEVQNPGLLPLGVTPANILQKTVRRNNHLAQIFHDLKLMEREGTGFDRIYETQLAQAKAVPQVREEDDRVVVRVERRILKRELIDLLARADQQFGLSSRERIALGLIAQHGSLTALEFGRHLQIEGGDRIRVWLGTLPAKGIVLSRGQTRATEYFIAPDVLRATQFKGPTTLKAIAPHRLEELIRADLALYPVSSLSEVVARIGSEIPIYKVKRTLESLRRRGVLRMTGLRRWARYSLAQPLPNNPNLKGDPMAQTESLAPPDATNR